MDADLKKIKKLTDFMKKSGLIHLKQGDIELNLAPSAVFHVEPLTPDTKQEDLGPKYSQQEMLFWSSPGLGTDEEDAAQ